MIPQQLPSVLSGFNGKRILVIGDFIIDTYIKGIIKRIAPEAPVPVVDVTSIKDHPGGAANAALNLRYLSADVHFCSVTGNDAAGKKGRSLLEDEGISTKAIILSDNKATQAKTRIMTEQQAIVRYDLGDTDDLDKPAEQQLIRSIQDAYSQCDALLLADYEKGLFTPSVIEAVYELKKSNPKFIAVDSKRLQVFKKLQPDLVKPNAEEAQKLLGISIPATSDRIEQLSASGPLLEAQTGAGIIALTLDKDGAIWFEKGHFHTHMNAQHVPFPQVSGAGDTFISAALLALTCGATIPQAAEIAACAATVVIRKEDTAYCTRLELEMDFPVLKKRTLSVSALAGLCLQQRQAGKKIIFTNGCFDILHSGHIRFLQKAKELGDMLIVGLNTDESVRRLKGNNRPINGLAERMDVLAAIGCIDYIIPFGTQGNDTVAEILRALKPDLFVKGGDYSFKELAEAQVLASLNIPVQLLPFRAGASTTSIIRKIKENNYTAA